MRRDELYLLNIIESADRILGWLADMSVDQWAEDEKTRRAVLQLLITMGEAARATDLSLKGRHGRVPWQRVVTFRNVAVHEYFAVNWATVWRIVSHELAVLREQVLEVLRVEFPDIVRRRPAHPSRCAIRATRRWTRSWCGRAETARTPTTLSSRRRRSTSCPARRHRALRPAVRGQDRRPRRRSVHRRKSVAAPAFDDEAALRCGTAVGRAERRGVRP